MKLPWFLSSLLLLAPLAHASPYRDDLVGYNLNVVKDAQSPLQYDSERPNTTYTPSPGNWRALPTYTILMDKFADGDPSNNDFFKSPYEWDWRETQLRTGGDLKGLESKLDYLEGMGVKVIFMSGTPFLNMLWQADSKCQLDPLTAPSLIVPHRLLSSRLQCPRPSLGQHRRLAPSHRRDPRPRHVFHGRFHGGHHVRSDWFRRVRCMVAPLP